MSASNPTQRFSLTLSRWERELQAHALRFAEIVLLIQSHDLPWTGEEDSLSQREGRGEGDLSALSTLLKNWENRPAPTP